MLCQTLSQSVTPDNFKAAVSSQIQYFLKGGGLNQKKENAMLLPFSRGSKQYPSFGPVSLHLWEKRGPSSQGTYG